MAQPEHIAPETWIGTQPFFVLKQEVPIEKIEGAGIIAGAHGVMIAASAIEEKKNISLYERAMLICAFNARVEYGLLEHLPSVAWIFPLSAV